LSIRHLEDITESIVIRNLRAQTVKMYLEPWGDELPLVPGVTYQIQARGPATHSLELDLIEEGIVVHSWTGSLLTVFSGSRIVRDCRPRVPSLPGSPGSGFEPGS